MVHRDLRALPDAGDHHPGPRLELRLRLHADPRALLPAMQLKFRRDAEHEATLLRALYKDNGEAAPAVFVGIDNAGNQRLQALVSREEWTPGDMRWHVSMSTATRVPSWDEIAYTLHKLRPGVPFVLGVPPRSWWMNVNKNVLHAWETKDEGLIGQWRFERQGDTPT